MPNSEYTTDQIAIISSNLRTVSDETYPSKTAIAADYNATAAYNIGDYCLRNSLFYKCNTAISSSGEAWNSGHWDQVDVGSELKAGVPSGGNAGQLLMKSSSTDYATEWSNWSRVGFINILSTNWTGDGPWSQVITFTGETITSNTMVNLKASVSTISQLQENDITEIVAENDNGTITIYCRGFRAPKANITLQYSLIDINKTGNAIVIGDSVVVGCLDYWDFTDAEFTADTGTTSEMGQTTNGMISNGWVLINLDFTLKALTSGTSYKLCELSEDLYMKVGRTYRSFTTFTTNGVRATVRIDTWSTDDDVPLKSIYIIPRAAVSSGDLLSFGMLFPVSYNI